MRTGATVDAQVERLRRHLLQVADAPAADTGR